MSTSDPPARGRPPRRPHPIEELLAPHFRPTSVVAYGQIAKRIDASGLPAEQWLATEIERRAVAARVRNDPSLAMPKRTLSVYRAAVAQYVALIESPDGPDAREVARRLPQTRPLRDGRLREALTPEQLRRYRELAREAPEPQRTMLLLLPLTGLRVSEVCYLEHDSVDRNRCAIVVHGKGAKSRRVDISRQAWQLLSTYLADHAPLGAYVFMLDETASGEPCEPRPCRPRDLWATIQQWRRAEPELLGHLAIHQTRHTTATGMLAAGANIRVIQDVLGHASLRSLERYLHPTEAERRSALQALDEAEAEGEGSDP